VTPEQAAAVSLLLVRRQLLTGSWSSMQLEHYQVSKDPALLNAIEAGLQEHLTPQQVALLKKYDQTVPARTLIAPVASRLEDNGRAMSEAQHETVLQAIRQFQDGPYKRMRLNPSADLRQQCIDSHASMNARDESIRDILARSLDGVQMQIAQGYYRDLFDERARMLQTYQARLADDDDAALCAVLAF
jgi:hypothetical protein